MPKPAKAHYGKSERKEGVSARARARPRGRARRGSGHSPRDGRQVRMVRRQAPLEDREPLHLTRPNLTVPRRGRSSAAPPRPRLGQLAQPHSRVERPKGYADEEEAPGGVAEPSLVRR